MSRGLPLSEAMAHVGLKRRTFDSLIRPRVTPIRVGTSLIFDVHDLDRAFDELKAASQASDVTASATEPAIANAASTAPTTMTRRTGENRIAASFGSFAGRSRQWPGAVPAAVAWTARRSLPHGGR